MSNIILTLEKLRQLRHRAVQDVTGKLSAQKQLCQRYERNIHALSALCEGTSQPECSAVMMSNQSSYKRNIQRVIAWQEQEQALAEVQTRKLQADLLSRARQEKSVEQVLSQRRDRAALAAERQAQKITDAISAQCWLRQHPLPR